MKLLNQLEPSLARMHNRSSNLGKRMFRFVHSSQLIHQEEEIKEIWTNFLMKNQRNKFHNNVIYRPGFLGHSPGSSKCNIDFEDTFKKKSKNPILNAIVNCLNNHCDMQIQATKNEAPRVYGVWSLWV